MLLGARESVLVSAHHQLAAQPRGELSVSLLARGTRRARVAPVTHELGSYCGEAIPIAEWCHSVGADHVETTRAPREETTRAPRAWPLRTILASIASSGQVSLLGVPPRPDERRSIQPVQAVQLPPASRMSVAEMASATAGNTVASGGPVEPGAETDAEEYNCRFSLSIHLVYLPIYLPAYLPTYLPTHLQVP